jgi:tRNA(Ile2) C34 agmatinyltransferase TiaS
MAAKVFPRLGPVTFGAAFGAITIGMAAVRPAQMHVPHEWARETIVGAVTLGAVLGMLGGAVVERQQQVRKLYVERQSRRWTCPGCGAETVSVQPQPRCPQCQEQLTSSSGRPMNDADTDPFTSEDT